MFTPNANALTKDDSKPSAAKILSALRARHASAESAPSSRALLTPINHVKHAQPHVHQTAESAPHDAEEPGASSAARNRGSAPVFMTPAAITPSDAIRSASPRQHTPPFHVKDHSTLMSVSTVRADTDEIMRSAGVFGTPAVGSPIPPARNTFPSEDMIKPLTATFAKEVNMAVKFGPAHEFETPGMGSPTDQEQQVASSPWVVHDAQTVIECQIQTSIDQSTDDPGLRPDSYQHLRTHMCASTCGFESRTIPCTIMQAHTSQACSKLGTYSRLRPCSICEKHQGVTTLTHS
jgi:hypothetical protein